MRCSRPCLAIVLLSIACVCECHAQPFEIDLPANGISYSSSTGMLYATISGSASTPYGNTLIEISPANGSIVRSVSVGGAPSALAVAPDEPVAFVGIGAENALVSVNLTSLTAGTPFSLGSTPRQVAVMPGAPNTVAVSLGCCGSGTVAIFDAGVMRGTINGSAPFSNAIGFGSAPNALFGFDNYDTAFGLSRYTIDSTGITSWTYVSKVITGFGVTFVVDNNIIYATSGAAVDGATLQLIGTYRTSGPIVVDDSTSSVIFVHPKSVQVFDRDTFVPVFSLPISAATGNPASATGCGSKCVAAVFDSAQIFILPQVADKIFENSFE